MPLPLLILAGVALKAIVAKAAIAKTIAVAAKGTAVLAKATAGHGALVAKGVTAASQTYGTATVVSAAVVTTLSVGAAAIVYDKAAKVKREIENENWPDALVAAASLLSEVRSVGGLEDVKNTLDAFVSSSGTSYVTEVLEKTSSLLGALEYRLKAA